MFYGLLALIAFVLALQYLRELFIDWYSGSNPEIRRSHIALRIIFFLGICVYCLLQVI